MTSLHDFRLHDGRLHHGRISNIRGRTLILGLLLLLLLLAPAVKAALPALTQAASHMTGQPHETGLVTSPGKEQSVTRRVTVPDIPASLDLVPVLDLTGSYAKTLPTVRQILPQLQADLARKSALRVGLTTFMDDPCCGGAPGDYPYQLNLALTDNRPAFSNALASLRGGNGGDNPESWLTAVADTVRDVGFRPDAYRFVLLSTDANSHHRGDASGSQGPTVEEVAAILNAAHVHLVALLPRDNAAPQAVQLAQLTGGSVQYVSRSSSDLDRAILAGLKAVVLNIEPSVGSGCPIDDATFSPSRVDGVTGGTQVPFHLSFRTAKPAAPGAYHCPLSFGGAGTQTLDLQVTR